MTPTVTTPPELLEHDVLLCDDGERLFAGEVVGRQGDLLRCTLDEEVASGTELFLMPLLQPLGAPDLTALSGSRREQALALLPAERIPSEYCAEVLGPGAVPGETVALRLKDTARNSMKALLLSVEPSAG